MAMISGGDESARNAFRANLRDDSSLSIISTEEMSPGDILEVRNLADAIERAERALRESSRPRDMFAELGDQLTQRPATQRSPVSTGSLATGASATDDASGPAIYAKPTLTPLPPAMRPTPIPPALIPAPLSTPQLPILMVPNNEEDAFMQPAGRMRHFAEETLDGYRPESTLEIARGTRRKTATVIVGAVLGVLAMALGAGVVMACMPAAKVEAKGPPAVVTLATAQMEGPKPDPTTAPAPPKSSVPTMNVNDLPTAR